MGRTSISETAVRTVACMAVVLEELGKLSENIFSWERNIEEVQSDPVSKRQSLQGKKINKFIFVCLCDKSPPTARLTQVPHLVSAPKLGNRKSAVQDAGI